MKWKRWIIILGILGILMPILVGCETTPPPPPPPPPPAPRPGMVWIPGQWMGVGPERHWVPGYWAPAPVPPPPVRPPLP